MRNVMTSGGLVLVALGAVATGCSSQGGGETSNTAPLNYELFPNTTPAVYCDPFGANVPAGNGTWPISSGADGDAAVCRDCTHTDGTNFGPNYDSNLDVENGNVASAGAVATAAQTHLNNLWTQDPCVTGANSGSNFRQAMTTAINDAAASVSTAKTWTNDLGGTGGVLDKIGQAIHAVYPGFSYSNPTSTPNYWVVAFKPNRWRFRTGEWINPTGPWTQPSQIPPATWHLYNTYPLALTEARFRGARSYCSMRQAALAQYATGLDDMGELSLSGGETWLGGDIGLASESVHVGQVEKRTTDPGANIFLMPIQLVSRVNPFAGSLFPEVMPGSSHEIYWVSGDAEYLSAEDEGAIYDGGGTWVFNPNGRGLILVPNTHNGYRKYAMNGEHSDVFVGQSQSGAVSLSGTIPIIGNWISVSASASVSIDLGVLVTTPNADDNGRALYGISGFGPMRSFYWEDVVSGTHAPWTAGGARLVSDAPLLYDPNTVRFGVIEDGPSYPTGPWWSPGGYGLLVRAFQDDDRSIVIKDEVHETFSASIDAHVDLGVLDVGFSGGGSIDGTARQYTVLREQVSTVNPQKLAPNGFSSDLTAGQTNFVANSRGDVSFNGSLGVNMHAEVHLVFYDKEWDEPLLTFSAKQKQGADRYGESSRLRVGAFTDYWGESDNGTGERDTYSHLPDPGNADPTRFTSFPNDGQNNTVGTCLASNPYIPPPPPPGDGTAGGPLIPAMCVKGPPHGIDDGQYPSQWQLPSNICDPGVIASYLTNTLPTVSYWSWPNIGPLNSDKRACVEQFLEFMCTRPNKPHKWIATEHSVSTVMDAAPVGQPKTADQVAFDAIFAQGGTCMNAFVVGPTDTERHDQADFVVNYLHPVPIACDVNGTPIGGN